MKTYRTIAGDKWDIIAYKTLGNEKKMDLIIKENLKYKDLFILPAGLEIKIPDLPKETNYTLPPWKRGGKN